MFLLKNITPRNQYLFPYRLQAYRQRFRSSGANPQIRDESLKIDKIQAHYSNKDDPLHPNPFGNIEQSMGIPPFFDSSSIKDVSESLKLSTKLSHSKKQTLPFEEVPGPQFLKYIANVWKYIPAAGPYFKLGERVKLLSFLFDQYGPVVRVVGPFGGDIVLLNRPDHMQSVFSQEGPQPIRSAFDSLEFYRVKHRKFDFPGLYSVQGDEWNQQRILVENSLKNSLATVQAKVDKCCDDLVNQITTLKNTQDEVQDGFQQTLFKWSLECMGQILFSERIGLLEGYDGPQGDALWLEEALSKATSALAACESGLQAWKVMETMAFKKLIDNCNILDSVIGQYIRQTEIELHNKRQLNQDKKLIYSNQEVKSTDVKLKISDTEPRAFIKALLLSEKMKADDILTIFMDMLIVGVNSSTSAMSFILYHLAKSQRAQHRLFDELNSKSPSSGEMTYGQLSKLPYLQACIKESLRLVPPFPVLTRILSKNITLDNYKIPHGTTMVMAMQVAGLKEENFDDSKRFYPERWLRPDVKDVHPLATLPFGHGSRRCIGQGLADIMLSTLTAKIIKKYSVEYNYGDITPVTKLISMPNYPLRFRFIERE